MQTNTSFSSRPYTRQYKSQSTGMRRSVMPQRAGAEAAPAPVQPVRSKKSVLVLMSTCLALALLTVLVVPFVFGNTSVEAAAFTPSASASVVSVSYSSVDEAQQVLGIEAHLPAVFTADVAQMTAVNVLGDRILEVHYVVNKSEIVFRTAAGNEDVSGSTREYAFSALEEVNGVNRSYMGPTEKVFSQVTWAADGYAYAIMADGGLEADTMRTIAESVF